MHVHAQPCPITGTVSFSIAIHCVPVHNISTKCRVFALQCFHCHWSDIRKSCITLHLVHSSTFIPEKFFFCVSMEGSVCGDRVVPEELNMHARLSLLRSML